MCDRYAQFVRICSGSIILYCTPVPYLMMHIPGKSKACEPLKHQSGQFQAGLHTS